MGTLATSEKDLYFVLGVLVTVAGGIFWWSNREDRSVGEFAAECSDGSVIGSWRGQVRRRPGRTREQKARLAEHHPDLKGPELREVVTDDLVPGALSFARVRPGLGEEAPWVVEALNAARDEIRLRWEFETVEAAELARELLAARVVRAPLGPDRAPILVNESDLDAVRDRERVVEEPQGWLGRSPGSGGSVHAT